MSGRLIKWEGLTFKLNGENHNFSGQASSVLGFQDAMDYMKADLEEMCLNVEAEYDDKVELNFYIDRDQHWVGIMQRDLPGSEGSQLLSEVNYSVYRLVSDEEE